MLSQVIWELISKKQHKFIASMKKVNRKSTMGGFTNIADLAFDNSGGLYVDHDADEILNGSDALPLVSMCLQMAKLALQCRG